VAAMCRAVAAVLVLAALGSGAAQAWWDDSHGYRGVRAYAYGPPYRTGYVSGVTVRVGEWRYRHHLRRHPHRHRDSSYQATGVNVLP
jgi:hypothetical protein